MLLLLLMVFCLVLCVFVLVCCSGDCCKWLGHSHLKLGDGGKAAAAFARGCELAEQAGNKRLQVCVCVWEGEMLCARVCGARGGCGAGAGGAWLPVNVVCLGEFSSPSHLSVSPRLSYAVQRHAECSCLSKAAPQVPLEKGS